MITAGESVTLLVPILLALLHVERRRLDPRLALTCAIGLDDILFDERGAAVVTGVRLVPAEGHGSTPTATAVARRVVGEVLAKTVGGGSAARAHLTALCGRDAEIDELLEVLFELDEPAPLEAPLEAPLGDVDDQPHRPVPEAAAAHLRPGPSPDLLDGLVPWLAPARAAAGRLVSSSPRAAAAVRSLREVRARVWATAGILTVSGIVGLTVLTGPEASGEGDAAPAVAPSPGQTSEAASLPQPTPSPSPGSPPKSSPTGDVRGESVPSALPTHDTASLLTGDDADAAAAELLQLRAACLAALDRSCLEAVEQPGSPVLALDLAAIDDPARLDERPVDLRIDAVVNRLGGAVLYRARGPDDEPASVLVTRTEAGWRLRTIP
ncbi:hypothetical protein [Frondihabitans sucicola]|uniref:hypothetical protein n=1 Tax=Frondihabitans sucicola TaxID=1268041 RepID=UPI002573E18B|nr:hypothetical protein [Frondihabitans sucicola]